MSEQVPELTRGELLVLLRQYDQYIQHANDEDRYSEGWMPVCIEEFLGSEASMEVDNTPPACKVVVALEPFGQWRVLFATEDTRVIVVDRRRVEEHRSEEVLSHQDELALTPDNPLQEAMCDDLAEAIQNGEVSVEQINLLLTNNQVD